MWLAERSLAKNLPLKGNRTETAKPGGGGGGLRGGKMSDFACRSGRWNSELSQNGTFPPRLMIIKGLPMNDFDERRARVYCGCGNLSGFTPDLVGYG
jgi:hypothetical protein